MNRVVVTGMGMVSSNAIGCSEFAQALKEGKSGVTFNQEMHDYAYKCNVWGIPKIEEQFIEEFTSKFKVINLKSDGILYGLMSAIEAWEDAGLEIPAKDTDPDWDTGCIFGTNINGIEAIYYSRDEINSGRARQIGARMTQQAMNGGISAYLSGIFGLGNQVTSNSSACCAGSESTLESYYKIKFGFAKRMICGASESGLTYIWGPFDSMRALSNAYNDAPETASRPMNQTADGLVPSCGGGALVLENLDTAIERGAHIYAELLGGSVNSGGHRNGGSVSLANKDGVVKCIQDALENTQVTPSDIDLISGHLTSTIGDRKEIAAWSEVLGDVPFPHINSTKSMTGHALGASGAIELIASIIQMNERFVHPSLNAYPLHDEIKDLVANDSVPKEMIPNQDINVVAKTSLGFGDVNTCLVLKKYEG